MFYREWNQLRNGSKKEIDLTYRSNYNGPMQYYRMSATLWQNPDSGAPQFFGTIQNVTAIAEKEQKYNDTNALLKALVETLPCPVLSSSKMLPTTSVIWWRTALLPVF